MSNILFKIAQFITRHPRYIPNAEKIKWSDHSISYNLFRRFELTFGKRYGKNGIGDTIRIESVAEFYTDPITGQQRVFRKFYTKESIIVHSEGVIRNYFSRVSSKIINTLKYWNWKIDRLIPQITTIFEVLAPQFALEGYQRIPKSDRSPKGYSFAIGYTSSQGQTSDTSFSVSGSDPILFGWGREAGGGSYTPTYAGVNGTLITTQLTNNTPGNALTRMNYWVNPTSGSNTSGMGGADSYCVALYSGGYGIGTNAKNYGNTSGQKTITMTTTKDNCWLVAGGYPMADGSAGTGTTQRLNYFTGVVWYDSNGAKTPTGSYSLQFSEAYGNEWAQIMTEIDPTAPVTGPTNLKSLDTNVKANIKSYNTNALANIKSINTNA